MITIVGDTHGSEDHRLTGRTLEAVRSADLVVHTGDFTTERVLDAFEAAAGAGSDGETELAAVYGNSDDPGVRARLPATRVVEHGGLRLVVVHGHEHGDTGLSLLARQEGADLVVVGHSHRPGYREAGGVGVVNPGSYADPRRYRPAHVELDPSAEGGRGRILSPDGESIDVFRVGDRT